MAVTLMEAVEVGSDLEATELKLRKPGPETKEAEHETRGMQNTKMVLCPWAEADTLVTTDWLCSLLLLFPCCSSCPWHSGLPEDLYLHEACGLNAVSSKFLVSLNTCGSTVLECCRTFRRLNLAGSGLLDFIAWPHSSLCFLLQIQCDHLPPSRCPDFPIMMCCTLELSHINAFLL